MLSTREFEESIMSLDPTDDDFVLQVDNLVESVEEKNYEQLIPSIFRFFESHPLDDCGAPGTLVHLVENFYPNYKDSLLNSIKNSPNVVAILMVNRILNSNLSPQERDEYLSALNIVALNGEISDRLNNKAKHFIEYQASKSS